MMEKRKTWFTERYENEQKGDVIQVEISHETGTVDIVFGQDGAEPIYEGNGLSNSSFTLNITESGTYQISVTGNHAWGSVAFMKIPAETDADETDTE